MVASRETANRDSFNRGEIVRFVRFRGVLALAVSTLMLAAVLAVPSVGCATPGDLEEPVELPSLPWAAPYPATLLSAGPGSSLGWYFGTIGLTKGQTVSATMTVGSDVGYSTLAVVQVSGATRGVSSGGSTNSVQRLTAMASKSGAYQFIILGQNVGDFSLEVATTTPVPFRLSGFGVPKSKKRRAKFTISVRTNPRYNGFASPVRFQIERRKSGTWRPFTSAGSSLAEDGSSYSKFVARVKLSKKGTYRIRAKFSDAAHAKSGFSTWKSIKIK
jgi:hypothetical protein